LRRTVRSRGRGASELSTGAAWFLGPGPRKHDMICELAAVAALLYGLNAKHLLHIFETFH
jgi:hypothetical protein